MDLSLSDYLLNVNNYLIPTFEEEEGLLSDKHRELIRILCMIDFDKALLPLDRRGLVGRPCKSRINIARAFVAKAVFNFVATSFLITMLKNDRHLRLICGFETIKSVPSESTFSRAFQDFSLTGLPTVAHAGLVKRTCGDKIFMHRTTDSFIIKGAEKPAKKKKSEKRDRKSPTRLERQLNEMTLSEMIAELPRYCDVGAKTNHIGVYSKTNGFKIHIDMLEGCIPTAAILTCASTHDSQVAIPLSNLSDLVSFAFYELRDSAYDVKAIKEHAARRGRIALSPEAIKGKTNKERVTSERLAQKTLKMRPADADRLKRERIKCERIGARIKSHFGGNNVKVRGGQKVMAHLMFAILACTASELIRLYSG